MISRALGPSRIEYTFDADDGYGVTAIGDPNLPLSIEFARPEHICGKTSPIGDLGVSVSVKSCTASGLYLVFLVFFRGASTHVFVVPRTVHLRHGRSWSQETWAREQFTHATITLARPFRVVINQSMGLPI